MFKTNPSKNHSMSSQILTQILLGICALMLIALGLSLIYLNNLYISLGIFGLIMIDLFVAWRIILKNT